MILSRTASRRLVLSAVLASTLGLAGCFGLAVTGAAIGTMAVLDRRSIGAQTDDQAIELRGLRELNDAVNNGGHGAVAITSYNRRVLLSGQAISADVKQRAEDTVRSRVPNIREIYNEIELAPNTTFATRTRDTSLTARVKTGLVRERNLSANAIKVVSEDSTVFLLGIVTSEEAERASIIASQVSGVSRVVTLFEHVNQAELDRIQGTDKPR